MIRLMNHVDMVPPGNSAEQRLNKRDELLSARTIKRLYRRAQSNVLDTLCIRVCQHGSLWNFLLPLINMIIL